MLAATISGGDYQTDPRAAPYWNAVGGLISIARIALGDDAAFGLVLSRVALALRDEFGSAGAQEALAFMTKILQEAEN